MVKELATRFVEGRGRDASCVLGHQGASWASSSQIRWDSKGQADVVAAAHNRRNRHIYKRKYNVLWR